MRDYRCVEGEDFGNIKDKKEQFYKEVFLKKHPRAQNHYNCLNSKFERTRYGQIVYKEKCAYCGVNVILNGVDNYQLDHFVCKTSKNSIDVHKISNLAYSCSVCNSKKGDFIFSKDVIELLNPDLQEIKKIFVRNSDFSINIANAYKNNKEIIHFYKKIELNHERRRIDYAIMTLEKVLNKKENYGSELEILKKLNSLKIKRNTTII